MERDLGIPAFTLKTFYSTSEVPDIYAEKIEAGLVKYIYPQKKELDQVVEKLFSDWDEMYKLASMPGKHASEAYRRQIQMLDTIKSIYLMCKKRMPPVASKIKHEADGRGFLFMTTMFR